MVISVEISGIMEKRIRRLIDIGFYSSATEAVRDAVRMLLEKYDMREIALRVYLTREASLKYASEIADETLESFLDYMLSRGVVPALGPVRASDLRRASGPAILDPSGMLVIYKSHLYRFLGERLGEMMTPRALSPYAQILEARLARLGSVAVMPRYIEIEPAEDESLLLSPIEIGILRHAEREGVPVISDDYRVRLAAERLGVEAYSSLSLIDFYSMNDGDRRELIMSLKAIPVAVPPQLEGR